MIASMICATVVTLLALSVPAIAGDNATTPTGKTQWSEESHQRLAEAKRQRLIESRFAEKMRDAKDATSTQTNYDVLTYDIRMTLDHDVDTLYGAVKFHAQATIDGVSQVEVDFNDNRPLDSIIIPSGTLGFSRSNNTVTVDLDRTYDAGEQFEFDMFYHRSIYFTSFQEIEFLTTFFEPYDARDWWPCKDRMDDKADTFFIAITVDTGFYVGSNGTLDSVISSGDAWQTFYYTEHYPMASYLFSLAVSQYTVWHDEWVFNNNADTMPITHAVFPSFYAYSLPRYGILPDALTLLSELFGQYPFADEKYGHAMSRGWAGMEHQTMSTMGSAEGIFEPWVIVHELAHQWWGDMITCESWGDLWLNEGFATYAEALYFEVMWGRGFYHEYMNDMAYTGNLTVFVGDTSSYSNFFSSAQYNKGSWVMHMLRGVLDDSLFFAGLDAYANSEHRWNAATTEDLKNIYETVSGVELDYFFDQWVYGAGLPNYRWSYFHEVSDTAGYDVYLELEQLQTTDPQVFTMPIRFRFGLVDAPDDTLVLFNDQRTQLFKLNFAHEVQSYLVQLDPLNWILRYETFESWDMRIVTVNEELSDPRQYLSYADTIEVKGGLDRRTFTITNGALPNGFSIDSDGVVSGSTSDTGTFTFTVHVEDQQVVGYEDTGEFSLTVVPTSLVAGDIDYSGGVDVSDLVYLVDYMFNLGPPPVPCP